MSTMFSFLSFIVGDVRLEIVFEQLPADETSGRLRLPALETNRGTLNPKQEATPSLATAKETSVDASVAVAFTRHGKGFSYERISKNSTGAFSASTVATLDT